MGYRRCSTCEMAFDQAAQRAKRGYGARNSPSWSPATLETGMNYLVPSKNRCTRSRHPGTVSLSNVTVDSSGAFSAFNRWKLID